MDAAVRCRLRPVGHLSLPPMARRAPLAAAGDPSGTFRSRTLLYAATYGPSGSCCPWPVGRLSRLCARAPRNFGIRLAR